VGQVYRLRLLHPPALCCLLEPCSDPLPELAGLLLPGCLALLCYCLCMCPCCLPRCNSSTPLLLKLCLCNSDTTCQMTDVRR
jgi:hypothetical protein